MKKHLTILTTLLLGATLVTPVVSMAASSVYKRFVGTDESKFIDYYDITILNDNTQVMFDILAYGVKTDYFTSNETTYDPTGGWTGTENLLNTEMYLLTELSDGSYSTDDSSYFINNDNVLSQDGDDRVIGDRGNDGSVSDLDAWLYPTLNTGNYLLAVSTWNISSADVLTDRNGNFKDLDNTINPDWGSDLPAWYQLTVTGADTPSAVPLPAAVWLMGSGLIGLFGLSRRKPAVTV